jgi:hypothetical protein
MFDISEGEQLSTHRYMISSPACWAAYGEVLAREYSDPARATYYRLSVDSYAAQHPGDADNPSRQAIQSVGVHLLRLCLLVDKRIDMTRANEAMLAASSYKYTFVWLDPPLHVGSITVADVATTTTNQQLQHVVWQWAQSTWDAWSAHHATIHRWLDRVVNKRPLFT